MATTTTIISIGKGEAMPSEWNWHTLVYNNALHVRMGTTTFIFEDVQEGLDILNSLATVPPIGAEPEEVGIAYVTADGLIVASSDCEPSPT